MTERCPWATKPEMWTYHDREWGVPVHDDGKHFEFLVLEGAQAGLSWSTILNKREGYRRCFANFDAAKVATFSPAKIAKILDDPGIVRNRLKVECTVKNARLFLEIQNEFGSFNEFIWGFVDGAPVVNRWKHAKQIPATSKQSDALAAELKRRGFKFAGSTIMYAHMQAAGLVNDHVVSCFRHSEIGGLAHRISG
jgi:DNA-3-methyladenine glycosylase I